MQMKALGNRGLGKESGRRRLNSVRKFAGLFSAPPPRKGLYSRKEILQKDIFVSYWLGLLQKAASLKKTFVGKSFLPSV